MTVLDWLLSTVSSFMLLSIAGWLGRNLIITRLTKRVAFEFDSKLEVLRQQLREADEQLKAELRAREAEIAGLRSGAMTAMASRQAGLDKRRLEAVDQLYDSVLALGKARHISAFMAVVKFESAAKHTEEDPKAREMFKQLGGDFKAKDMDLSGAARAKPFLTPVVMATYSALLTVCMHSVIRWTILTLGAPSEGLMNNDAINKLISAALPGYEKYLEGLQGEGYHYFVELLEAKLLVDVQDMLNGKETDKAGVEKAAEIIRLSDSILDAKSKQSAKQFST